MTRDSAINFKTSVFLIWNKLAKVQDLAWQQSRQSYSIAYKLPFQSWSLITFDACVVQSLSSTASTSTLDMCSGHSLHHNSDNYSWLIFRFAWFLNAIKCVKLRDAHFEIVYLFTNIANILIKAIYVFIFCHALGEYLVLPWDPFVIISLISLTKKCTQLVHLHV